MQVDDLRVMMALAAAVVALLVNAGTVSASQRCPNGGQPDGRGRCVYVWREATCVRVGGLVWCSTTQQEGEVQP